MRFVPLLLLLAVLPASVVFAAPPDDRLRLIIETDAGGDPDDEQSLVRFLLYANDFDIEGIIANRPAARDPENKNPVRDGLGIVRRHLDAYGQVHPNLLKHDKRYPTRDALSAITVPGYDDTPAGVDLIIRAVDREDLRPLWFSNWGTDKGSAESSLKRALDKILKERGPEGYAKFKSKLRLSSADKFGDHTWQTEPPFPLWVATFYPAMDGGRWYHRFSALTKSAGGFDLQRDVLENHGPLGALYPTYTGMPQKEGDTPMFLRLIPNGLNAPDHPEWGSWAGRFGRSRPEDQVPGIPKDAGNGIRNYFCPNQRDTLNGKSNRDFTLSRWAPHIQNDFRARLQWCVKSYEESAHPPTVLLANDTPKRAHAGDTITLDASATIDPDHKDLSFEWTFYPEESNYPAKIPKPQIDMPNEAKTAIKIPKESAGQHVHFILAATTKGTPGVTRYARVIIEIEK